MQPMPAESKENSASAANKKESALGGASSPPVAAAKPSSSERDRLLPNAPSSAGYASTASGSIDSIATDMDPDAGRVGLPRLVLPLCQRWRARFHEGSPQWI